MNDLDDLLPRRQAFHDLGAYGPLAQRLEKAAHDLETNVSLEQRQAYLTQGGIHVGLAQFAAPAQPLEHALQAIGKRFKHNQHTPLGIELVCPMLGHEVLGLQVHLERFTAVCPKALKDIVLQIAFLEIVAIHVRNLHLTPS